MEPRHLQQIRQSDGAIPRYLFRGFNEYSGGNRTLNTETAIIPHAFHDSYAKYVCPDTPLEFGDLRNVGRCRWWFYSCCCGQSALPHVPIALTNMSRTRLSSELSMHLQGETQRFASHFTSWTADLKIAMDFARKNSGLGYVGVLDTAQRQSHNTIMHVPVLFQAGLVDESDFYTFEYLIYGPVRGKAYTCIDAKPAISGGHYPRPGSWGELLVDTNLTQYCNEWLSEAILRRLGVRRSLWMQCCLGAHGSAVSRGRRHYRLSSSGNHCTEQPLEKDLKLFLIVVAAHWGHWCVAAKVEEELDEAIWGLSQIIWKAANDPQVILPLVNANTYVLQLPKLALTIKLLQRIEAEITKVRSQPPEEPWNIFGWTWSQVVGQKSNAGVDASTGTMPDNKRAKV